MRYIFGDYVLDTQRLELHHAGQPIKLRRKVFQVLVYLLAHRDRVVPKQELLERLWPDQFVGDETLTSCIKTLRKVLGERGRTSRFLRTLHGQGYRFVGAVEVRDHMLMDGATLAALPTTGTLHPLAPRGGEGWGEGDTPTAWNNPHPGPLPAGEGALREVPSPFARVSDGEHKQVTVLCCALAEASTLAARLGPEAMYHLMHDVLALAQDTVQRYEGTLTQASGDGFLALFGAPVAQEDHARQAVLAALKLCQRLRVPNAIRGHPHGVAVRLGLHTGLVVVSPLAYEPQRSYTAAGETLQLATWIQQRATPDTCLVSAATYALVQGEVQGEALAIEGPSPPGPVYAIRGFLRRQGGVPRRGARPLSRFAGRTQELALLHERLAQAVGGQGQVIGIAGEPGMGKSRLLTEFVHRLRGQPVTCCEGHCLAYGRATPYLPVRDLLRQLWGLPDASPATSITATVQQRLREAGVASEDEVLVLLQLLDVPVDLGTLAAPDPPMRKARTFAVLWHVIRHASQRQPLLLAVENLHWIDPTSEEWLASLVERLGDMPVLLLATYRPGHQPPWIGHSAATQMALPRLSPRDSLVVLQSVPQAAQLPAPLQQAIVAKAAGNPFFVEELTWAAVEHGDPAGPLPLPDTIEAVLAARIDRLPAAAKCLVQTAAVIGTEVPVPLLQRLAGLPDEVLQQGLAHLQGRELLYETHRFPDQVYAFKHALTREVAYGSLLHERRRALHRQTVEALEALYPDRLGEQVERLAYHALRGKVWDKALSYSRQAGARADMCSAYPEAVASFEQALKALTHLPESRDTLEQAIDLRLSLRTALLPLGELRRIHHLLRDAATLAETLGDQRRLGLIATRLCHASWQNGDYKVALEFGQRALAISIGLKDIRWQRRTNVNLADTYHALGEYGRAIACYRTAVSLEGGLLPRPLHATSEYSLAARAKLSQCLAELGAFAEGISRGEEGIRMAEAADHPFSRAAAYGSLGNLYVHQGAFHKAIPLLERAIGLCQVWQIQLLFPSVASPLGVAYALSGRVIEALPLLEQAVKQSTSMQFMPYISRSLTLLSEGYLLAGRSDAAIPHAQRALKLACQHKEQGIRAWILRLLGEIAARRHPPEIEPAEEHYGQALALADELSMRPLVAHCHRGLGTLYAKAGRPEQARAALESAIELYRAMEMAFWLPQAEDALAAVEGIAHLGSPSPASSGSGPVTEPTTAVSATYQAASSA
jgi:DNA-binding winged helix-turn-helix (wHTH) protein/class 3 adenylate cyclase/tetratricopeptide (TPR) repeat protein